MFTFVGLAHIFLVLSMFIPFGILIAVNMLIIFPIAKFFEKKNGFFKIIGIIIKVFGYVAAVVLFFITLYALISSLKKSYS